MRLTKGQYYWIDTSGILYIHKTRMIAKYLGGKEEYRYPNTVVYPFEFIEDIKGSHDCEGKGKKGHCIYIRKKHVMHKATKQDIMAEQL